MREVAKVWIRAVAKGREKNKYIRYDKRNSDKIDDLVDVRDKEKDEVKNEIKYHSEKNRWHGLSQSYQ